MAESHGANHLPFLIGIPVGGITLGFGIRSMYGAVGWQAPINEDLTHVGFSGLDNIAALGPFPMAAGLIVVGIGILAFLNSIAWRHTGGY